MNSLKNLVLGVVLLGLTSCASVYEPYPTELRRIRNLPYQKKVSDCKHKSVFG